MAGLLIRTDFPRETANVNINIYCDESCHLENDGHKVMLLGAVWCPAEAVRPVSEAIRELKRQHGLKAADALSHGFEVKWSKVGPAKAEFYESLIKLFLEDNRLNFRALIVPDKATLDHGAFNQSHDEFYYKLYYLLLLRLLENEGNTYDIYLDIKDGRGGPKVKKLHDYLCSKLKDHQCQVLRRVEQIRSHESEILQLCDLLLGAISYYNRSEAGSSTKLKLIDVLANHGRSYPRDLSSTSYLSEQKINLFYWGGARGTR